MSSIASLTPSQRVQLSHFQAVVALSDEQQAVSILQNHNWSLEDAVANALIMEPRTAATGPISSSSSSIHSSVTSPPPVLNTSNASLSSSSSYAAVSPASSPTRSLLSSSVSSSSSSTSTPSSGSATPTRGVRNASPASLGWYDWLNSYPLGWLLTSALTFCSQLVAAVLPSTLWHGPAAAPPTRHAAASSAPSALVTGWLQQWPHSPPFVPHSYLTAVRECKAQHKLLFLYLHHPSVRTDARSFVGSVLCSEAIRNFVSQNFIAWMGSAQAGDGARLASTLRVRSYPFVALLAPVNNQLAVMYRREGETAGSDSSGSSEEDEMIHAMLLKMEQYDNLTAGESRAEAERVEGRNLRAQQDREYQESLERDREQQRKKERDAEQKRRDEEERQAKQRAAEEEKQREERRKAERLERRQELLESLPLEPAAGGVAVVTVSVRLVDGKKISRRWEDSTPMDRLFDWIDGQPVRPGAAGDAEVLRGSETASGGVRVVSNFPRKYHTEGSATVKSLGLGKQILLMIEPVELEESGESQH